MGAEYTLMTRRDAQRDAAAGRYVAAVAAADEARAECDALRELGAPTATQIEARERLNKAQRAHAEARSAVLNAAWGAGAFKDAESLGEAVESYLATLRSKDLN